MIQQAINQVSMWAIPVFLLGIPLYGAMKGVKVYESFVEGAKEGFQVGVRIIPYLVAILVAVGMLRGAGAIDVLGRQEIAVRVALQVLHCVEIATLGRRHVRVELSRRQCQLRLR